eukprot:113142-Pelagomonas_calceolata.AAC.1
MPPLSLLTRKHVLCIAAVGTAQIETSKGAGDSLAGTSGCVGLLSGVGGWHSIYFGGEQPVLHRAIWKRAFCLETISSTWEATLLNVQGFVDSKELHDLCCLYYAYRAYPKKAFTKTFYLIASFEALVLAIGVTSSLHQEGMWRALFRC